MSGAIEGVEWHAIPGPVGWYRPDYAASGLQRLASATSAAEVAKASSMLENGGLLHGHSAAVLPAVVAAAPILLNIAECGNPTVRGAALEILDGALSYYPLAGFTRVAARDGGAVPICCAVACCVRAETDALRLMGKDGKGLLAEAAKHWCFEIHDSVPDEADTVAIGEMEGIFPKGSHSAELHTRDAVTRIDCVTRECLSADESLEACLRLVNVRLDESLLNARLYPGECAEREH